MTAQQLLNSFKAYIKGDIVNLSDKQVNYLKSLAKKECLLYAKAGVKETPFMIDVEENCIWVIKPVFKKIANKLRGYHGEATGRYELRRWFIADLNNDKSNPWVDHYEVVSQRQIVEENKAKFVLSVKQLPTTVFKTI